MHGFLVRANKGEKKSMGGRGGNSVFTSGNGLKESGLDVTFQGETTRYYFTKKGNDNYYQQGFSGMPQPTPQNMSAAEFKQRVLANGAAVKDVTASEYKADMVQHGVYRKEMDKFLNTQWYKAAGPPRHGMKGH